MSTKSIIFAGNFSTSGGTTHTFTPTIDSQNASVIGDGQTAYNRCNVILDIKTLTGTSVTASVQEKFSSANSSGFVETANSGALTATGQYILANDGQTSQTKTANIQYGFAMLGQGTAKQIVFTNSSVSAISIDVYFDFYDGKQ